MSDEKLTKICLRREYQEKINAKKMDRQQKSSGAKRNKVRRNQAADERQNTIEEIIQ